MTIFGSGRTPEKQAFVRKASHLVNSARMELYASCEATLAARLGRPLAGQIADVIGSYVFRFGEIRPEQLADKSLMQKFEEERPGVLAGCEETLKTRATAALILLGATREVSLQTFRQHLTSLAVEGFAKVGEQAPDVRAELLRDDQFYFYEAGLLAGQE